MNATRATAVALAIAFLAGRFEVDELVERGARLFGQRGRWLRPLARRVAAAFIDQPRPRVSALVQFLLSDPGYLRAAARHKLRVVGRLLGPSTMNPTPAAQSWGLPTLLKEGELADWLRIGLGDLEWYADLKSLESKQRIEKLRHYRYRPLTKKRGRIRLIEAPKEQLKAIQRQVLAEVLDKIPPHDAAHGFRRGGSIHTFAAPHVGKSMVLKIDLQDFFPSIRYPRVQAIFRTAGYPDRVADLLTGLCTNATPTDIWGSDPVAVTKREMQRVRWLYADRHLPQGAPTSPAVANLCAYRLDCRLSALAATAGAIYTRYADDLAFSGNADFARVAHRFERHVCATVMEEGFQVHHRKTRLMRQGVCQRIAGLVVNEHLNVPRQDVDRLKAILTNCVRHGPESQNRDQHVDFHGHLHGRVCFVESVNPEKSRKLRELFERIEW